MVDFAVEKLSDIREEVAPLLQADWDEIQHDKDKIPLKPHWDLYIQLEAMEVIRIFTARSKGKLIGYMVFVFTPSMHSEGHNLAVCDTLYVDKAHRKGFMALRFMAFCEMQILAEGKISWLQVTTTERNPIDPIMKRLGYSKTGTCFEKVI